MSLRRLAIGACLVLSYTGFLQLALAAPAPTPVVPPAPPSLTAVRPGEVELLHAVPSVVVVSSLVNNKKMRAEHLVDGKLDTAWNSKTAELGDSTIDFFVPPESHVSTIRLTAGFLAKGDTGDLYTQNYRITKVRVAYEGTTLGDFELDPQRRELQQIPIDRPGGRFTITVLKLLPGTKTNWREVCISELEVWGTPPARLPVRRHEPVVRVGSLLAPGREPVADMTAYCKKRDAEIAAELAASLASQNPSMGAETKGPFCSVYSPVEGSGVKSPFKWAFLDNTHTAGSSWMSSTTLILRSAKGWHEYYLWNGETFDDPHCNGTTTQKIEEITGTPQELTVRYSIETTRNPFEGSPGSRNKVVVSRTCVLGPDRLPLCLQRKISDEELPY